MVEFIGTLELLILLGFTVVIGYVGYAIFSKTKIPDVIWLMLFGLLVGPVFNLVDRELFTLIAPFFSAVAILIILFDAGLNLNIYRVIKTVPRSFLIAAINMILSVVVVGYFSSLLFGIDLLAGFILGAMVGGTSSPVVIDLVERVKVRENVKDMLKIESVITDPLAIVITIALIGLAVTPGVTATAPITEILSVFSIGAVLGFISGLVWLFILDKLKGRPYEHLLTLAIVFIIYSFVEALSGSGAVAALIFGLVLGNGRGFSIMLRFRKIFTVSSDMKKFQNEISFFIRSFFFVFLGLMVVIHIETVFVGIMIAMILLLLRVVAVQLTVFRSDYSLLEKTLSITTAPRGMSAAVLALLPGLMNFPYATVYSEVVFMVILTSVVYSSAAAIVLGKRADKEAISEERRLLRNQRSLKRPRKVPSRR